MTKVRVHELAKVLDTNSKELIALLAEFGYEIKNHMSVLEEDQLDIIFEVFTQRYNKAVEIPNFGKVKAAPAPEAPQKKQKQGAEKSKEEATAPVVDDAPVEIPDEPIKRKVRHVDTRQTVVDVNKMDTEKLEELVPTNVNEAETEKRRKPSPG